MSRWAEAFAALSRSSDTLDTLRHSEVCPPTVSQSVNSVTVPLAPPDSPRLADRIPTRCGRGEPGRIGIVGNAGAVPHDWAEGVGRLNPQQPPSDVPAMRWHRFVMDTRLFLESPFCATAVALGWGSCDLFGCDADRPFARIDRAGLLLLLDGARLIALTEVSATIKTRTGGYQVWRRKHGDPTRVLAWELGR
jgi:hypothetical protein